MLHPICAKIIIATIGELKDTKELEEKTGLSRLEVLNGVGWLMHMTKEAKES